MAGVPVGGSAVRIPESSPQVGSPAHELGGGSINAPVMNLRPRCTLQAVVEDVNPRTFPGKDGKPSRTFYEIRTCVRNLNERGNLITEAVVFETSEGVAGMLVPGALFNLALSFRAGEFGKAQPRICGASRVE